MDTSPFKTNQNGNLKRRILYCLSVDFVLQVPLSNFYRKPTIESKLLLKRKHEYLIHSWKLCASKGTIINQKGYNITFIVAFSPFQSLSVLFSPLSPVESLSVPYITVPQCLSVPFCAFQSLTVPFSPFQSHLVPFSPLQSLLVPYSSLQSLLVPYSPFHSITVPYSPLQSLLVPFSRAIICRTWLFFKLFDWTWYWINWMMNTIIMNKNMLQLCSKEIDIQGY